ncbi:MULTISPECIES: DUF2784 domain-containing protein [Acidithiobacillus]|uniref:DUF2784 domain-containing protein n=1 Tax=Acidithiobacillus ferruginosus TaxID=3063951 RepID=A0ACD5IJX0_9PROT|nr:DUF2784 domain-containing protein [Acidithiobacillus ferruginosus]MBU2814317.1 DUF2784 domain-containing protein [Acidithiobacillus ferruginosus]
MQNELWLAQAILAFHILIIAFNVFGLIAIPLGAWRGWRWVRIFWWRALHLVALLVVAVQALLGTACFLTIWQSELQEAAGRQGYRLPLIQTWIDHLLFWHLPMSFFTSIYVLIWIGVLLLWWKVPPVLPWRRP